ncbi:oligopeptide ABC transporter permease [Geomicrobium sp. JCM 19039]|uniref:oligopeptide ABC transporter permease n=1 Tax=Geomicrobium sp. JCM 19039 TaxID=1460636 RepID=UPI00045F3111|nr:oligopeptide ABC transporter permease [Geomicrobium sp. JCM 19039]GAK11961.1 oligopeptide transport system permease protein OppC [Geomicrobium sp. JCM 19039]
MDQFNQAGKQESITPNNPETLGKHRSMLAIIVTKFFQNKLAVFGLIMLGIIVGAAVFAPLIAPHDPNYQTLIARLHEPSAEYWLGADQLGRDLFSRLLYAGQMSLLVGFAAMASSTIIGASLGAIAGYFGGLIDSIIMRIVDVLISFPNIFLLITLVALFRPSPFWLVVVFGSLGWMGTARLMRGEILSLKRREYVLAARTLGLPKWRIIFNHIMPNAIGPLIVSATLAIGSFIIAESTLSFLGLGISPPTATWGNMLSSAQNLTIFQTAWWYPLFPGLMIFITVLSFNFVGDGLRDALDPRVVEK